MAYFFDVKIFENIRTLQTIETSFNGFHRFRQRSKAKFELSFLVSCLRCRSSLYRFAHCYATI